MSQLDTMDQIRLAQPESAAGQADPNSMDSKHQAMSVLPSQTTNEYVLVRTTYYRNS